MAFLSFIKDVGEKLLNRSQQEGSTPAPHAAGTSSPHSPSASDVERLQRAAAEAIHRYILSQNFAVTGLTVGYNANIATVTVLGEVNDQETREKIMLCCGNVEGVQHVNDQMTLHKSATENTGSRYYTVASGDTLSRIAQDFYGDAKKYGLIFDANHPMLKSPDKIYPGQMLRIPPL